MKKVLKFIGYAFLGLIVLGVLGAMLGDPKPSGGASAGESGTAASEPPDSPEPLMQTTARELAMAYDENTVAADAQFKGKRFSVSGVVADINTDFMGRPYLTLKGGVNQFMEPQFQFDKDASAALAKVRKGARVVLECEGNGDVAKTPMSDDCELVQ